MLELIGYTVCLAIVIWFSIFVSGYNYFGGLDCSSIWDFRYNHDWSPRIVGIFLILTSLFFWYLLYVYCPFTVHLQKFN